ncbi:MAG: ABC transporter permease [Ruminiclostridium sp.]|nr:ABC transporter permease [Ruminiclostridium sp.]
MLKTKWMVICLFIGFLMAAGMMSAVPIYMDASLQRMLIKDMEAYQLGSGDYPGIYSVEKTIAANMTIADQVNLANELPALVEEQVDAIKIPVGSYKTILNDNLQYISIGTNKNGATSTRAKLTAMTGFEDHVVIKSGRMYCKGGVAEDGVYEVVVNDAAIKSLDIVLGGEYQMRAVDTSNQPVRIRIVGIFEQSDANDVYWSETMDPYINSIVTDYDCFKNMLSAGISIRLTDISTRYSLSYQSMDMNDLDSITAELAEDFALYPELGYDFEMGIFKILEEYAVEATKLTNILWILQIPTMVMLAFYLFMVSQLNVEQEKNEIAIFKSRGASSKQIFFLYAAESGIIGLVTLITAPFIGLALCRFLGVSNGFLEFVNRTGIAAKITGTAILYALLAIVVFFLTTMIPIIPASKLSIVEYKASKTKVVKVQLWEKCCVDIVLIAAAAVFYGIYTANEVISTESTGEINPLFFIFSTCLVLGLGLLFIRIYPYFLRAIYTMFKPLWSPAQYMAITSVSRAQGGKVRFLMLFLIVTFSLGIFSANTARTINTQKEDRIYYATGADIRLKEYWQETTTSDESMTTTGYVERDFGRYEELSGVKTATRVLINEKAKFTVDKTTASNVTLMAIEPYKFATTAWFRNDLLPVHWWNYTNALQDFPSGIIVSRALADAFELELGDAVETKWSGNDNVAATVVAIVDYWPGINPNESQKEVLSPGEERRKNKEAEENAEEAVVEASYAAKYFMIMNYNYIYNLTDIEPYEVWIDLEESATSEQLYNDISAKRIPIEYITDSSQLLIREKNEPQLQGMNGALTMSFVIIMIMTIIGFLIYWILSIRSRTLQFGILRAMGVTFKEIIGIIGYEQVLVSGVSVAMSFIIGGITSDLFVPLFRSMYNPIDQVPPFRVAALQSDYIKIYVIIVLMLGGGFAILGNLIKKLDINKALKLGED